jgi:hypothetical protein
MVELGSSARFADEAVERLAVVRHGVGDELQSDMAPKASVLGFVDDAHAAAPELSDDVVMGDSLADHA